MEETPTSAAGDHTDSGAEAEQAKATRSCNILAEEDAEAISVTPEQACKLYSPERPDLWHRTPTLHHQQRRRAKPRRKEETTNPIYNYTTIPRLPLPHWTKRGGRRGREPAESPPKDAATCFHLFRLKNPVTRERIRSGEPDLNIDISNSQDRTTFLCFFFVDVGYFICE
jgi:hypothetical protein